MIKILSIFASIVLATTPSQESMKQLSDRVFEAAKSQFTYLDGTIPEKMTPVTFENGELKTGKLSNWVSGFFAGSLWYTYEYTSDASIKDLALKQTEKLSGICKMKTHHDIGFQVNSSFGNAYRLTGDKKYLKTMKKAAAKLCDRFNPTIGCIKSWDKFRKDSTCFPVIIDNMMNLELLMNTYNISGGDSLKRIACTHANTTMKNHFREDGSCFHVLVYNQETGEPEMKVTAQGFCDASAWSRGCSWALYGYTMMFRETRDAAYLAQARKVAGFIIPMLPEDGVPEWDFNAPGTAHAMDFSAPGAASPKKCKCSVPGIVDRDASAGAIIASALIELSTFVKGEESASYLALAQKILRTLASDEYFCASGNGGFLLKHSVTNLHGGSGVNIPLTYADYYFLEALVRYRDLQEGVKGPKVMARHVPERADDFVFENEYIAGRIYGKGLEKETLSPGIDIWVKIPGSLIADQMYANKLSYHKFNGRGKDCYKVGKTMGAGASAVVVDGKLVLPATNWRTCKILKKTDTEVTFVLCYPEWEYQGEKISLDKKITVTSGTRFAKVEDTYKFKGALGKNLMVVAGVTRHTGKKTILQEFTGDDRYALWELASDTGAEPEDGQIGVGIYAPGATYAGLSSDKKHGIVGKEIKSGAKFVYYFGNCWSKGGVETCDDWFEIVKAL